MRGAIVGCVVLAACASEPGAPSRREGHAAVVRDVARELGLGNAALLAGIADAETHLAQCWSEATYGCRGPVSSACDGPVLAGSADGPCADMQGGLGMFQFDAGTWSDTLATYGDGVLSDAGSTRLAVPFVAAAVMRDVPGISDPAAALAWLDRVPIVDGDATFAQWSRIMACRYNGCCADTALCASRAAGYRDHTRAVYAGFGAAFWAAP
ncbi:MAG TPA: hypothetical protein VFP84_01540 [Kofleriaceae bacterium]|nr:hypothetical protein [Kofleriaceae bacterium]